MQPSELGLDAQRFPFFRQEVSQWETVVALASSGTRYDLLQAPCGCGKSLVYNSLGLLLDARYCIVTPTRVLQDQNMEDFSSIGMADVRGHGNYPCADYDRSPYEPACRFPRMFCTWDKAVREARDARAVVTNYACWLRSGDLLGKFDMLVLDEAHGAMGHLTDAVAVTVQAEDLAWLLESTLPRLEPGLDVSFAFLPWARETLSQARERLRRARPDPESLEARRRVAHLQGLIEDLGRLVAAPESGTPWVVEYGEKDNGVSMQSAASSASIKFTPVWPAKYAEELLFRKIPKVVLTSATLSPEAGRHLGIAPDSSWHEVESGFDPRLRPVYVLPAVKVEWGMPESDLASCVTLGDIFLGARLDRKGLIQTPSYDLAEKIYSRSRVAKHMITHGRGHHTEALAQFVASAPPSILLSPAVREGWDGRGPLARFTWIPKVPLLNRKIPLIRARCQLDPYWHDIEVATAIQQWVGRLVRHVGDWGEALITDKHAGWLFAKKELWPRGFLAAVRKVKSVPPRLEVL